MKIYCIENKITGKKYVGKTVYTIDKRFQQHLRNAEYKNKQHLHKAIAKYGKDNFTCYLLEDVKNKELLSEREMYWIKTLDTKNNGYNETDGGEGSLGRKVSEKTRKKHSKSSKEWLSVPENREFHQESTKDGMKRWWNSLSKEERKDWINRCKKRPEGWVPPKGHFTYNHTEEAKEKIRQYQTGRPKSKEHTEKMIQSRKGKGCGERNAMANPENREKQRQGCIGRKKMYRDDGSWYWGRL